jgi:lysophospholipase L1-like esterase
MIRRTPLIVLTTLIASSLLYLFAQQAPVQQGIADSPSTPISRMDEPAWSGRFERKQKIAQRTKQVDLLFLGDSITHNYERADPVPSLNYKPVWNYYYGDRNAFDLGFSGDTTGNLLWRLDHGETAGMHPCLVVLLIGTNNTSTRHKDWSAEADTSAIEEIVSKVHEQMPEAHVLVIGNLPSGQSEWKTGMTHQINSLLAGRYGSNSTSWASYIDISSAFLKNGQIDNSLFVEPSKHPPQGAVHPTAQGQALMAAALEPTIARLMHVAPKPPMPTQSQ